MARRDCVNEPGFHDPNTHDASHTRQSSQRKTNRVVDSMTVFIRTGLLFIPAHEEGAAAALRQRLRSVLPGLYVLQEAGISSRSHLVEETLRRWCDEEELDLVLTIGGTLPAPGPSGCEIVPDATLAVVEKLLPGLPEAMRAAAREQSPLALLDRSVAGIRGRTLILNLPAGGGPALCFLAAVEDVLGPILAYLREQPYAPSLEGALTSAHDESVPDALPQEERSSRPRGLQDAEFAAFLARRRPQE